MKKVTIQDIAANLGLSRNTVAKALNGGEVSAQTRQMVVQKALQMGYAKLDDELVEEVKNNTRKMNEGTILVLSYKNDSAFWTRLLSGISKGINEEGYRMLLRVVEEQDIEDNGESIIADLPDDIKGVVFMWVFPIDFIKNIDTLNVPLSFFNTPVEGNEYVKLGDVISVEGFYSMSELTEYIIRNKGCRKLSYIGNAQGTRMVQARYLGYLSACRRVGLSVDESLQFTKPAVGEYFGYNEIEMTLNSVNDMPDVFVCENDDVAQNLVTILATKNIHVPQDILVTGFDDIFSANTFKDTISTVHVNVEELGIRLVKSIAQRNHNPNQDHAFITVATYVKLV